MARHKISLIGAGNIGGTLALLAGLRELGDVTLDIAEGFRREKPLILRNQVQLRDLMRRSVAQMIAALADSDVDCHCGVARKPGMSRDDLIGINTKVMNRSVLESKHIALMLCDLYRNPLDVMVGVLQKASGLPAAKVVGMAGVGLGTFPVVLAEEFDVSVEDVTAFVLGGHGDTMVPLVRYSAVADIPVPDLIKMGWSSDDRCRYCKAHT